MKLNNEGFICAFVTISCCCNVNFILQTQISNFLQTVQAIHLLSTKKLSSAVEPAKCDSTAGAVDET
jgi:hypothetical protein